jgi:TatD DNase family protein
VVKNIPMDRILLETDAPYLTPSSKKGQKNEPGFLLEVAQTVSEIKGVSLNELAVLTSANAEKLFGA